MEISNIKISLMTAIGLAGSFIATLFGGWDTELRTLILFMAVDYITGLMVAGVFKNSSKTKTGALQSKAGWKGLCKKGMTLFIVLVAYRLELMVGSEFIRNAVIIAYIVNETISIIENAGLMGIKIPQALQKGIDILVQKTEGGE